VTVAQHFWLGARLLKINAKLCDTADRLLCSVPSTAGIECKSRPRDFFLGWAWAFFGGAIKVPELEATCFFTLAPDIRPAADQTVCTQGLL
jgi:hypothetical protein